MFQNLPFVRRRTAASLAREGSFRIAPGQKRAFDGSKCLTKSRRSAGPRPLLPTPIAFREHCQGIDGDSFLIGVAKSSGRKQ